MHVFKTKMTARVLKFVNVFVCENDSMGREFRSPHEKRGKCNKVGVWKRILRQQNIAHMITHTYPSIFRIHNCVVVVIVSGLIF